MQAGASPTRNWFCSQGGMFSPKGLKGIKNLTHTIGKALQRKSVPENEESHRDSYEDQENKNSKVNGPQSPVSPETI